jgi:hypothetical protein
MTPRLPRLVVRDLEEPIRHWRCPTKAAFGGRGAYLDPANLLSHFLAT